MSKMIDYEAKARELAEGWDLVGHEGAIATALRDAAAEALEEAAKDFDVSDSMHSFRPRLGELLRARARAIRARIE